MVKLKILTLGDYPQLSEWAQCNNRVHIRGKQEEQSQRISYLNGLSVITESI